MKMMEALLSFTLVFALLFAIPGVSGIKARAGNERKTAPGGTKIAYVPIDNRPVNYDRAKYLARMAGVDLLMPEEDLFRSALDNMPKNKNGTSYGDRVSLVQWLKDVEKDGDCEYYVLSLDQLLSGGLVTSRWFSNTDLSLEYEIADYIISLSKKKKVVLFDTVMRLASTVNYEGYQMSEYNLLRAYGAAGRATLNGGALNVANIIAGYRYDSAGQPISTPLPEEKINKYLASRERKLKLTDYILERALGDIDFCFIGVDDSSNGVNIQTNEINYIRSKIGDKGACFAATDELGLMGITRVLSLIYGGTDIQVRYYGGAEDDLADSFDFETLRENVTGHIRSLRCTAAAGAPLEVLVFTNANHADAAAGLVARAKSNIQNHIPTIIIDPTYGGGNRALENALVGSDIPLTLLLAYSNWNTAGNAMGIALANGIARYLYLKHAPAVTAESHAGFLQAMTFSYLKDISFKLCGFSIEDPGAPGFCSYSQLLSKINESEIITSLSPYGASPHGAVTVSHFRYPWNRSFEMTFDIHVPIPTSEPEAYALGDVNGDKKVTVTDYIIIRLNILGLKELESQSRAAADIDGDGKIGVFDYLAVRLHILGITPLRRQALRGGAPRLFEALV